MKRNSDELSAAEQSSAILREVNTVPYNPLSASKPLNTVMPLTLSSETQESLNRLLDEIGEPVDEWLYKELRYTSRVQLNGYLAAEQVDAVALAILQLKNNKGLILGDQAGIGKGRVCAAIQRYAFINNKIPIFITEKSNLFSDNYRDLQDIGGMDTEPPRPLIMNGYSSGGKATDEQGNKYSLPSPNAVINLATNEEIFPAQKKAELDLIYKTKKMPEDLGYILMTYSQLSGESAKSRIEYLMSIAPNAIFILDECHNASGGTSQTGLFFQTVLPLSCGVLFASATYAKRPNNMYLYSAKTDISESVISTKDLLEAIATGGNQLSEYLSSNLVRAGQMIRRERSYDKCEINFNFPKPEFQEASFQKYDTAIAAFNLMEEFCKTELFQEAKQRAVQHFAEENDVQLAVYKKGSGKKDDWRKQHYGEYEKTMFTAGELAQSRFNFIETLLFALKADFVADMAIFELENKSTTNDMEGGKFTSERKVIIAVRNTLETVFDTLELTAGAELRNADFSYYIRGILAHILKGVCTLKRIKHPQSQEEEKDTITSEIDIKFEYFSDNGARYREIWAEFEKLSIGVPLSPIDAIIQKVESRDRPKDNEFGRDPVTGQRNPKFKVGEVTGRRFNLFKNEQTGISTLFKNRRNPNKTVEFADFNNGTTDLLLINESGSTGVSAHSSSKFKDKRPRAMIIHQVELDVNTEVQKRGRIFRTGQVYYPTYTYAVSLVPSEIRRLLMLKRKMKGLDANISANQSQGDRTIEITDSLGGSIEDIYNKYGAEVLATFLEDPSNERFLKYAEFYDKSREDLKGDPTEKINSFCRYLELANCEDQSYFYDSINVLYKKFKARKQEENEWDIETSIEELQASIKNRVVITKNKETSPFNYSVFEEDDWVLETRKPYTKEQVQELIDELADGKDPKIAHAKFIDEYKKYYNTEYRPMIKTFIKEPNYANAKDKAERAVWKKQYLSDIVDLEKAEDVIYQRNIYLFTALTPDQPVIIPERVYDITEASDTVGRWVNGKFCGVRLTRSTSRNKYSASNIEFLFAQLEGARRVILKPTQGDNIGFTLVLSKLPLQGIDNIVRIPIIAAWQVDPNLRVMARFLTGNLLDAYTIAQARVTQPNAFSSRFRFIKFTTTDGSLRTAIQMFYVDKFFELNPETVKVKYPINYKDFAELLSKSIYGFTDDKETMEFIPWATQGDPETVVRMLWRIYGGSARAKDSSKFYKSDFYADDEFLSIMEESFSGTNPQYFQPKGKSKRVKLKCNQYSINWKDPENMARFAEAREYIYSKNKMNISFVSGKDADAIVLMPDTYVPGKQEKEEPKGEYKYYLTSPYAAVKEGLSQFSKFVKHEAVDFPYGVVTTNQRCSVGESMRYNLAPITHSFAEIVNLTYGLFTDTGKIEIQQKIKSFIKEKAEEKVIGSYIYTKLLESPRKIVSIETLFGQQQRNSQIGHIFKSNAEKKPDEPAPSQEPAPAIPEPEKSTPLNMESAQDYVILMTY